MVCCGSACALGLADPAVCAQSGTQVKPFICTMPLRLDEGWNQVHFNLSDFTRRAYGALCAVLAGATCGQCWLSLPPVSSIASA